MKNKGIPILFLIFAIVLTSCVKDLDFDQTKDFESKPVYTATILYFDLTQRNFVSGNFEIGTVSDTLDFSLLSNEVFQKQLEKVELRFKISNEFNRGFRIELDFLDKNFLPVQHIDPLEIPAVTSDFEQRIPIVIKDSPLFLTANKLNINIQLKPSSDGSIININQEKKLSFKSSADFYIKIE